MQPWSTPQLSFEAGTVGDDFIMRRDTQVWGKAARRLDNTWPLLEGGIKRRPGTFFKVNLTAAGFTPVRMITFHMGAGDGFPATRWVMVFNANLDARIYAGSDFWWGDGGDFEHVGGLTMASGFHAPTLPSLSWYDKLQFANDFDHVVWGHSIILAHRTVAPHVINFTIGAFGHASFTLAKFPWAGGSAATPYDGYLSQPWFQTQSGTTLQPNVTSGAVELTPVGPGWNPNYGKWLQFMEGVPAGGDGVLVELTGTTSGGKYLGNVRKGTLASTAATSNYRHLIYEESGPDAVWQIDNRLVFGGGRAGENNSQRNRAGLICMSRPNFLTDFRLGKAEAGDAIIFDLGGAENESIGYGVQGERHHVLTNGSLFSDKGRSDVPLETATVTMRKQDNVGTAKVKPELYDGRVVFVDAERAAIREVGETEESNKLVVGLLSFLAKDTIKQPKRLAVLKGTKLDPETLLVVVNDDGTLAVCLSISTENITSWRTWTTNGEFIDAGTLDRRMAVIVRRQRYGSWRYYLEVIDSGAFVDSAVMTSGANNYWPDHLGGNLTEKVLNEESTGTNINTTATGTNHDQVGLPFEAVIETLPLDGILSGFPQYGRIKRIVAAIFQIANCIDMTVDGSIEKWREFTPKSSGSKAGRLRKQKLGFSHEHRILVSLPRACRGAILGYSVETRVSTIPNG